MIADLFELWYPLLGTTGLWMLHLVSEAALTRTTCTGSTRVWVLHLITAVTAAGALAGAGLASVPLRRGELVDYKRFLGQLGVLVSLTNALLILGEGLMVVALGSHRCG
ncbi:MAG TPA: hypothetical protein VHD87_11380 [Acidimicrobiales bacterium]|nr:hypothetical protein [Acidimicrobiales bacterium]HVV36616.1 hypothetical protein [Acidimicrobiales bacterium]